ncbi:ABC transporter D family protein [Cavenderia fasciculata]|uniref:ABC transporter D family protein n=1 Tax=Cavenderia fasciculata TaxID=261658 RepID=F4Q6L7_CACFS|nr:ABC transporter D family protein [Cavenderia fasciculata]EGG16527.1 ABC transporter D family protein [Cavenderia fasciculata]|eukprot:XP_004354927.1 ABC transporter D family protein [Cavenderia fasciculata]
MTTTQDIVQNRSIRRAQQKLVQLFDSISPKNDLGKKVLLLGAIGGGVYSLFKFYSTQNENKKQSGLIVDNKVQSNDKSKKRVTVDAVFFRRLGKIIKIIIPSIRSKEFLSLMFLTSLLLARTMLSVSIAEIAGRNAQNLVARKWKEMRNGVLKFAVISIPASFVNSALKKRLSEYVHKEYLEGVNFYKASHLGGSNKIDNADQRVTSDIEQFCNSMSNLYTTVFKPVLDLILFTQKLVGVMGWGSPMLMFGYFIISGFLKRIIMPPFGRLTAKQSELEGNYRTVHQRLITNAEEIAFYDGSKKEREIINLSFGDIFKHTSYVSYLKCLVGIFDGFLVKYCASIVGYGCMALPIYLGIKGTSGKDSTELTKDYIRNTQLMVALAQAIGQLVLLGNKITNMAGYTSRVSELLEMIKSIKERGSSTFTIVNEDDISSNNSAVTTPTTTDIYMDNDQPAWLQEWRRRCDQLRSIKRSSSSQSMPSVTGGGNFIEGEFIKFENVSIVSPEGKLLVTDLNFEVKPHQNVMITGPNGSGKSSLFRILGELWPLHCGTVIKPRKEDILFVPQKPYLVLGTLRDQIIYPHSAEDMARNGITDEDLQHLLQTVDPNSTIIRQWAWDDVKDWFTALSGGQKQRIAMARLFYHRPQYAILDECTSAVSDEVEGKIYETCKTLGITLFTVSHRQQLRAYHDYQLLFDGRGGWEWTKIDHSDINKPLSYK